MAGMRNLNDGNVKDIFRRLRKLETSTMLGSASIGEGRVRFYDNSELLIENGALNVTGSASISGVLNVSGQTNLIGQTSVTGPMTITGTTVIGGNTNITGELNVTGPTTLDGITDIGGDTTITGNLGVVGPLDVTGDTTLGGTTEITGITTLRNDLELVEGGKIRAGNLEIEPANGGQINFLNGSISSDSFGLGINNTLGVLVTGRDIQSEGEDSASILSGGSKINVTPAGINMFNVPVAALGNGANLYIDPAGKLWRANP